MSEFLHHNVQSEINPHVLWEVTKCHIGGACTSFSSHLNRTLQVKLEESAREMGFLESQQKSNYTEDRYKLLSTAKSAYRSLSSVQVEFLHLKTRQKHYEFAERPSRLLALKLKQSEHLASIDCVRAKVIISHFNIVYTC